MCVSVGLIFLVFLVFFFSMTSARLEQVLTDETHDKVWTFIIESSDKARQVVQHKYKSLNM